MEYSYDVKKKRKKMEKKEEVLSYYGVCIFSGSGAAGRFSGSEK